MNKNPLLDDEFLKELYRHREKEVFAKIIALTLSNDPIEEIQGQVTGGSVSLDGASSVRRTCTLTLVAKDLNINQYYWGLKNRFRLYIGLRNVIGQGYEDIIWFPMGTYVISNFTTSQSVTNYTINITGKDKMTLLNGELSGSLFASVDFGKEEYYKDGITTISYIPIKNIIREAVHAYANESWENIVVNDLEDYGIELLDYKSDKPMYLYFYYDADDNTKSCYQSTKDGEKIVYHAILNEDGNYVIDEDLGQIAIKDIENENVGLHYDKRIELDIGSINNASRFFATNKVDNEYIPDLSETYVITKITSGQTCGYRLTDITYPGDLILGIGEPLTALFDKLVAMLGNFEYFYDIDGRFIFQRKKTFIDKTWNNIKTGNQNSYVTTIDETYAEAAAYATPITWTFGDSFLITAYSNTPALSNVRNDFSIWGTKASIEGSELPVHLRYAVDKKPTYYKTFDGVEWTTETGQWWVKKGEGVVDTTWDELAKMVREEAKEKIRKRIKRDIMTFTPQYGVIEGLQAPVRNEDGSWTDGWWDIRDWHDYYRRLTGQEPRQTMKWYSHNSRRGCVSAAELHDPLVAAGYNYYYNDENHYAWLLTVSPDGTVGDGHGGTTITNWDENTVEYYGERGIYNCHCYYSYLKDDPDTPEINEEEVVPQDLIDSALSVTEERLFKSYRTNEQKIFILPYCGCSDNHTYYYFLYNNVKRGYSVYFYAPNFPAMGEDEDFEQYIEEEVERQLSDHEIWAILTEKGYRFVERKAENLCDWREIIFQMALDYRKHNHDDDFYLQVRKNNGLDLNNQWYYPAGRTGYEQYYVDMEGFWRQLYCPPQLMGKLFEQYDAETHPKATGVWTNRNQHWYYSTGAISPDSENGIYFGSSSGILYSVASYTPSTNLEYDFNGEWINSWVEHQDVNDGWNIQVIESPETLNFWFDFLEADEDTDLVKYSVPTIGDRTKSVNDNMVKAIYFRETPNVLFFDELTDIERKSGYTYLLEPSYMDSFNISSQGKSAYDVMEEYINLYLYCIESISITSVPIYHLQPNTRVMVYDEDSKINGEYLVSKITIPLTYNGTMSVSAVKSAEIIY